MATRKKQPIELVGTSEIAERLGIAHPETVHLWRRRYPEFPEPIGQLSIGYVWAWPEVEEWANATGRLPAPKARRSNRA